MGSLGSAECWVLGAEGRKRVGSWQLAVGSGQLAVGSWQWAVGCWLLVVGSYSAYGSYD